MQCLDLPLLEKLLVLVCHFSKKMMMISDQKNACIMYALRTFLHVHLWGPRWIRAGVRKCQLARNCHLHL